MNELIIVVGAGIGGLSAALGLTRKEYSSIVLEQLKLLEELDAGNQTRFIALAGWE